MILLGLVDVPISLVSYEANAHCLFHINGRTFMFPLSSPFFFAMEWTLSFQTSVEYKGIATDVTSMDLLPSGLLPQVYLTLSSLRQKFLLYFSSLSALPHLQVVVPICDLAAKVFSPSFTTDVLPSYNTAHHLIRDVNSSKESFSHRYFLFQGKEYICLLEDSEQAMCLFKMSAVRFKVGSFKTVYPSSKLFLKIIWRAK